MPPRLLQPVDPAIADNQQAGDPPVQNTVPTRGRRWRAPSKGAASIRDNDHSHSLRSKLVLALALMLGIVVCIDEVVRKHVITPEFANLERVAASREANRLLSNIRTEISFLSESAFSDLPHLVEQKDLPTWDFDGIDLASNHRIDWAAIAPMSGDWTWILSPNAPEILNASSSLDASGDHHEVARSCPIFSDLATLIERPEFFMGGSIDGITRGSDGEIYFFAAFPIDRRFTDPVYAPGNSFYIVGQRFDESKKAELIKRTNVLFSLEDVPANDTGETDLLVDPVSNSELMVKAPLTAPLGNKVGLLEIRLPRDIMLRSERTTAFARHLSLCGFCVSLLLLLLVLQRIVIGRIETIREHTERIAQTGILPEESMIPDLEVYGEDEIGQLAQSFDRMRNRLSNAQRRLSNASHAAGMSLVADTVIHNVGNVLTNINSLIETATRRVERLRTDPLRKLADRLSSDSSDEAFKAATPDYLKRLSETLEDDKRGIGNLLSTLNDNVQHIHEVIRDQHRHANQPVQWEHVALRSVIGEAVRCSQAQLDDDNIRVVFATSANPMLWTDRSLLLQILINILGNARNAMHGHDHRQPEIAIDWIQTVSRLHIRIRDNGCGMDPATLQRVFDAHFTTRESGSGLGLHFCANAMKRIGGEIHVESDGRGQGATFVLELPLDPARPKNKLDPAEDTITDWSQHAAMEIQS